MTYSAPTMAAEAPVLRTPAGGWADVLVAGGFGLAFALVSTMLLAWLILRRR